MYHLWLSDMDHVAAVYVGVACTSTASCVREASSKLPFAYWSTSAGCSFPVSYIIVTSKMLEGCLPYNECVAVIFL